MIGNPQHTIIDLVVVIIGLNNYFAKAINRNPCNNTAISLIIHRVMKFYGKFDASRTQIVFGEIMSNSYAI